MGEHDFHYQGCNTAWAFSADNRIYRVRIDRQKAIRPSIVISTNLWGTGGIRKITQSSPHIDTILAKLDKKQSVKRLMSLVPNKFTMFLPHMKPLSILLTSAFTFFLNHICQAEISERVIFRSGEEGYSNYRIPSLITTKSGSLLAFCEARKDHRGDSGNIDLVVKRSTDGGKTWSPPLMVWDAGDHTAGNPCPVIDQRTGRIINIVCWNCLLYTSPSPRD